MWEPCIISLSQLASICEKLLTWRGLEQEWYGLWWKEIFGQCGNRWVEDLGKRWVALKGWIRRGFNIWEWKDRIGDEENLRLQHWGFWKRKIGKPLYKQSWDKRLNVKEQNFYVVRKNCAECHCLYQPVTEQCNVSLLNSERCFLKTFKQGRWWRLPDLKPCHN